MGRCPSCGALGCEVRLSTVEALLDDVARLGLAPGRYRFCAQRECRTVYFDPTTGATFSTGELRAAVREKEAPGSGTLCYCLGDTEEDVRREIARTGTSMAPARVRSLVAARACACELRNPRGVCCLRDLATAVRALEERASRIA